MKKIIYILLLFVLFTSCRRDDDELAPYEPKLVVEGSIENGRFASVLLTVSAPVLGPKDSIDLLNHVVRSALVTVSDGERLDTLYLRRNSSKLPPYEYVGTKITGEINKEYHLKIYYRDQVFTSSTYIPEPVRLDEIWFGKINAADTTGYPYIRFRNTGNDYYFISTSTDTVSQKVYTPCLYGTIDKNIYKAGEEVSLQLNKGIIIYPETDYTTYFSESATIMVRFSTISKEGYDFWQSYQNEILNSQNPIFPANSSLKSNINGGIGIWCGYGSYYYEVRPL